MTIQDPATLEPARRGLLDSAPLERPAERPARRSSDSSPVEVPEPPVKVLLLTHRLPWPLHDGYNLHNYHYVRQLRDRHEFHLVSLGDGELPDEVAGLFASVTTVPLRRPPAGRSLVQRVLRAFSVHEMFDRDPAVIEAVRRLRERVDFDVVWCSGAKMLVHAALIDDLPVLGDIADEALKEARHDLATARGLPARLRALRQVINTRRFQRHFLGRTPVCTVVSQIDKRTLEEHCPGLDVRVIPNGVDAEVFRPLGTPPRHPSLVFEGSMAFLPNVEGIVSFVEETLPLVREGCPEVELTIVGKDPAPEVAALAGPGVEVTGFVDDVRPYVDRSSLFVCPLRRGAGIKNKILQAWAMEKAVVATPVSCGGLALRDGENIVVAESPRQQAEAILDLLRDPERRSRLGREGRRTVLEHSSWEATADHMAAILADVRAAGARR